MGKVIYGGGIAEIRGAVGGTQYSRNQYGAYLRPRTNPVQPNTVKQMAVRQKFREVAAAWTALEQTQQVAWNKTVIVLRDSLGNPKPMKGFALFMQLNKSLLEVGATLLTTPPINFDIPTNLTSVRIDCSQDLLGPPDRKSILVEFEPTPIVANHRIIIRATPKNTLGRTTLKGRERVVGYEGVHGTSPLDFTSRYEVLFGQMAPEDVDSVKIWFVVQVIYLANGIISKGVNGMCIYGADVVLR